MEFRVLGPLEVRAGDEPLPLGSPAERHLLAVLLVYANKMVSTDRLVDELWSDNPPPTARNIVQRYVSRLRRILGDSSGERLVTASHGYRLRVESGELDSAGFEQLVAEGRASADPSSARESFGAALDLWRGPFLDGIEAGSAVGAERVRWEEAHLVALEERIDADLALGRHGDLVAELQGLTGRFPLRERLRGQLMVALYRGGRQAEALRAFATYRERLREEAGLDPSAELSQLEGQILLADPALAPPAPAAPLPSGEVTFLFTDIEGSTPLWEQHPEGMPEALARHDEILRRAVAAEGGVVFKSVGDGFCAAFWSAVDALRAALDAQLDLAAETWGTTPLRVRMAAHTGAVDERDGDYVGPVVNRAARLLAAAHGGQIVASQAAAALVQDRLAVSSLTDLGEYQLKGLSRPERVFQLCHPGLPESFPPLRTPDTIPGNLPAPVTSFIGREAEIDTVVSLVRAHRLVTFTGVGGVGKTRLALHVAEQLASDFDGGAWVVQLSPISDPASVPQAVAGTFGITQQPGIGLVESIASSLDRRGVLFILDSCEHVVAAAADLAGQLCRQTSGVHVLATSREALLVDGEQLFPVPSLASQDAASSPAVRLFVDRAQLVVPAFSVDGVGRETVRRICEQLDGIPLAIELAAARVRSMRPAQILERLGGRFRLLTGGSRQAEERHQTLLQTVEWSYDLLDDDEKCVLCRASVFAGGFSLDAAEDICAGEEVDRLDVFDLLDSLVRKSLVTVDRSGKEARYGLLETIRQFAEEKLEARADVEAVRDAHAAYFAEAAGATYDRFASAQWKAAGDWFERELGNLRAAFSWAVKSGQPDYAADIHPAYMTYLLSETSDVVDIGTQPLYGPSGLITSIMARDRILERALAELGVEARFHAFLKGFDVNHFLRSGRLDAGVGGDMPALTIAAEENVAVTSLFQLGFSSIVAHHELPIGDLRGAKVAYAYGSNAHFVLLEALRREGIDDREIGLTAMDVTQMPGALGRGEIDAFSSWEPFPSLATTEGLANAIIYQGMTSGYLYFTDAFAKAQPAIVCELVAAGIRALLWMRETDANLQRASEWLIDDAESLAATFSGGATPEAIGLTPALISQMARRDIVGLDSVSQIPADLLADGGRLCDEFNFLQKIGAIPAGTDWSQVSASFDPRIAGQVLAKPDQYRFGEFSYSDGAHSLRRRGT